MKRARPANQAVRWEADRARRGGSGALSLAIRSSEAESPLEGHGRGSAPSCTASMARGPRATSAREPGQVRKEAALSGLRWAQRGTSRPEPLHDASLRGPDLDGGCTVHLLAQSV